MNDKTAKLIELRDRRNALKRVLALSEYLEAQFSFEVKVWSSEANMHEVAKIPISLRLRNDLLDTARRDLAIVEQKIAELERGTE